MESTQRADELEIPSVEEESGIIIPVTTSRREREARSFWKRLSFRRHRRSLPASPELPAAQAAISRLETLDERLAGVESAVELASERLETRMLQFWEIEEQVGRLARLVSELETSQRDLAERSHRLTRSIVLLALVAVGAAGVALVLGFVLRGAAL